MNPELVLDVLQQLTVPQDEESLCWWTCTVSCEATSAVAPEPSA